MFFSVPPCTPWSNRLLSVAADADGARVDVVCGPVEDVARSHAPFDGFNLSDVFEYVDAAAAERMYAAVLESARAGARLAYWNMLVPRRRPERFASRVRSLDEAARALHARDRAFFYSAFVLEVVA